jgi:hypothetical protein
MTTIYVGIRSQEYVDIPDAHPHLEVDCIDLGPVHSENKPMSRQATMLTALLIYDIHEQTVKLDRED